MPAIRNTVSRTSQNTKVSEAGRYVWVRLHQTVIFSYDKVTDTFTLDTGGWNTPTTIRRMNEALREFAPAGAPTVCKRDFAEHQTMTLVFGINTTPVITRN